MPYKSALVLSLIALAPFAARAQTPTPTLRSTPFEPFIYQPAAQVEALTHKPDGKTASAVVSDHEYYYIEYVTRGPTGNNPEAHGHWYDYIHVLAGEGTITYGGTQQDAKDVGQAEMRGGTMVGARTITLRPGDRLVIPPGLPHLFTATPGNTFTYLIFKQRV
jgi:quercetin dioxygenase-like cupin family protein